MLEQITLLQLLVWLLTAGGIAIVLQRIPGWEKLDPKVKTAILSALSFVAPYILAFVKASPIFTPFLNQTIANIIIGLFMLAASFVIHTIDQWLTAKTLIAQINAEWALEEYVRKNPEIPGPNK